MPDSSAHTQGWREEDVVGKGVWHQLADGTCIWSLSIVTSGAYSHVVVFRYITKLIPSRVQDSSTQQRGVSGSPGHPEAHAASCLHAVITFS